VVGDTCHGHLGLTCAVHLHTSRASFCSPTAVVCCVLLQGGRPAMVCGESDTEHRMQ
jgi:hypothetical protein